MKKQSDIIEEIKKQAELQQLKVSIDKGTVKILTSNSFITGLLISEFRRAGDTISVITRLGEEQEDNTCKLISVAPSNAIVATMFSLFLTWANLDGSVQPDVNNRITLRQIYKLSAWTNPKAILDSVIEGAYYFGYFASGYIKNLATPIDDVNVTGQSLYIEMHDEFEPRAGRLYRMMCEYPKLKKESDKADMITLLKEIRSHCPNASSKVEDIKKALEVLFKDKVEL